MAKDIVSVHAFLAVIVAPEVIKVGLVSILGSVTGVFSGFGTDLGKLSFSTCLNSTIITRNNSFFFDLERYYFFCGYCVEFSKDDLCVGHRLERHRLDVGSHRHCSDHG